MSTAVEYTGTMNNGDLALRRRLIGRLGGVLKARIKHKLAKKALFYDGIYYSVEIARRIYSDLVERCHTLGQFQFDNPVDLGERAIADAWSIIDSLYRIRRLLEDMPGLKQNSPQLQLFYRKTSCLKNLRDSIQHLDEYIDKYAPYKIPAWGRLSWVYPIHKYRYKACMIAPGDIQPDWKLYPSHYGKKMRAPIDFITLTGNREVCLTEMIDALEKLVPWLNTQLDNNFDRKHQFVVMGAGISAKYNIYP